MIVGSASSASTALSVKRVITCFILTSSDPTTTSSTAPTDHSQNNNNSNDNWFESPVFSRDNIRIAIFQRQSTMPTFPSYWAGISGSIEENEVPYETAIREIQEETNLIPVISNTNNNNNYENVNVNENENENVNDGGIPCEVNKMGGLYLDVPYKKENSSSIIRVYPFLVRLLLSFNHTKNSNNKIEIKLKGTEHDNWKFVSIQELEQLSSHCVPGLVTALHHATYGKLLHKNALPQSICEWSNDHVNGAATLARNAIELAMKDISQTNDNNNNNNNDNNDDDNNNYYYENDNDASNDDADLLANMAMLRPSMVAIVNSLKALQKKEKTLLQHHHHHQQQQQQNRKDTCQNKSNKINIRQKAGREIIQSLDEESERIIQVGADSLYQLFCEYNKNNEAVDNKKNNSQSSLSSSFVFTIAIFSRSSTLLKVIKQFLLRLENDKNKNNDDTTIKIICSKSTPGDEGEHMAQDLIQLTTAKSNDDNKDTSNSNNNNVMQLSTKVIVRCVDDESLQHTIQRKGDENVNCVLVGADCVMKDQVVNKIGTKALVESCRYQKAIPSSSSSTSAMTTTICVADRWKLWDDIFPPPLEDIFECIPRDLFDHVIVPSQNND